MERLKKLFAYKYIILVLFALIQLSLTLYVYLWLKEYIFFINSIIIIGAVVLYLYVVYSDMNVSFKITWITMIFLFPVFSALFFYWHSFAYTGASFRIKINQAAKNVVYDQPYANEILSYSREFIPDIYGEIKHIYEYSSYQPYTNTRVSYLASGEEMLEVMLIELDKAQEYIFLEYFIIAEGKMFDEIYKVLRKKLDQGVLIRIIYDDMGAIGKNEANFFKKLAQEGFEVKPFNPVIPILTTVVNNRDHRKIAVIDGKVAFNGGINIGDEYINLTSNLGYWKDTALMLEGDAAWGLGIMFLSMWDAVADIQEDILKYRPYTYMKNIPTYEEIEKTGIVMPFFDNSLDNEYLSETLYLSLIANANRYIYITTPYFVPTEPITRLLIHAAKRGVDVKIALPYIQDKLYMKVLNKSYYRMFIEAGVKIYEYLPGFLHAKSMVIDDELAIVGSINLDYRSFFFNMECATIVCKNPAIDDIKADIEKILDASILIERNMLNDKFFKKLLYLVMRIFAPLM